LESRQDQHLKALSEQTGHSEAKLIRQAIDRHLIQPHHKVTYSQQSDRDLLQQELQFIQSLKQRKVSGKRDWTRKDLYDR
jgi:predicted DNA-binding protein